MQETPFLHFGFIHPPEHTHTVFFPRIPILQNRLKARIQQIDMVLKQRGTFIQPSDHVGLVAHNGLMLPRGMLKQLDLLLKPRHILCLNTDLILELVDRLGVHLMRLEQCLDALLILGDLGALGIQTLQHGIQMLPGLAQLGFHGFNTIGFEIALCCR